MKIFRKLSDRSFLAYFICQRYNYCSFAVKRNRVYSGIQPSGSPHLGNYIGALKNWGSLQNSCECIFGIVDMHSVTLPKNNDPDILRDRIEVMAASLLAVGLDPEKCSIYVQSSVPEHGQLCWLLSCLLTTNRMFHFPQFKEKSLNLREVPLGLYLYPILQAADVLLYRATDVPVGEDQLPHVHLMRDVAQLFNKRYGNVFPVPRVLLTESSKARLRDLRNPSAKMSKSAADPRGRIDLVDEPDAIRAKIRKAVTDFTSKVTYDPEKRPGVATLVEIHALAEGITTTEACDRVQSLTTAQYKDVVSDALIAYLAPIRQRIVTLLQDRQHLWSILEAGAEKIRPLAAETLDECRRVMGMKAKTVLERSRLQRNNR